MPRFVTSASRTSVLLVVIAAAAAALPPAHAWAFVVPSVPSTAISSRQSLNSRHADMSKLSSCNRQISTMPVQPVRRDCTGTMTRGLYRTSCSMTATPNAGDGSSDATGSKGVEVELEEDKEAMVHVSLPKPLGVQFEEIRAGFPGLMVSTILEGGSAIEDGRIKKNMLLVSLNGNDVTGATFDFVMETMVAIPAGASIDIVFRDPSVPAPAPPPPPPPPPAKPCVLTVYGPNGKPVVLDVKEGDNLRRVLLNAKIEVYDMMGKLSNCNGAGQCGTCVVDVEQSDGWAPKPNWEMEKLKGRPKTHRLSCQSIIKGDATIATRPPKGM